MLNLFFCNNSSLINTVEVIPGISDHKAVCIEASLRPHKTPQPPRTVFCYNKADYDSIKKGLYIIHRAMSDMLLASVDKLWTIFKNRLSDLMHAHIPAKDEKAMDRPQRQNPNPEKNRLYTRTKTKKQQDTRKYRQCKGDVPRLKRHAYYSYINNIIEVNEDHDDKISKQKMVLVIHQIPQKRQYRNFATKEQGSSLQCSEGQGQHSEQTIPVYFDPRRHKPGP